MQLRRLTALLCSACVGAAALAGQTTGTFQVFITLQMPSAAVGGGSGGSGGTGSSGTGSGSTGAGGSQPGGSGSVIAGGSGGSPGAAGQTPATGNSGSNSASSTPGTSTVSNSSGGSSSNSGGGSVPVISQPPSIPAAVASLNGFCTTQSANAIVSVACSSGTFVSIEPAPGAPFAGTNGAAFRFAFGPGPAAADGGIYAGTAAGALSASHRQAATPIATDASSFRAFATGGLASGTVTAMRVIGATDGEGPVEMLVSF